MCGPIQYPNRYRNMLKFIKLTPPTHLNFTESYFKNKRDVSKESTELCLNILREAKQVKRL